MRGIVPRAELVLILIMVAGFLLIVQQWSFDLFQFGLVTVMAATILNIAVGNLPRAAGLWQALRLTTVILLIVAAVFAAGIFLVPYPGTARRMSRVRLQNVSRLYRDVRALDDVTVEIMSKSLTVLCGPPAAGKSVLLRLLVGLEQPDAGRILINDRDITDVPAGPAPHRLRAAILRALPACQRLRQHRLSDGVAEGRPVPRSSAASARWRRSSASSRCSPSARPSSAAARSSASPSRAGVLKNADLFLLDDPLVGLDFKLRESLMEDLKDMRAELGATFLYVTSDSLEALTMAEDIIVLDAGHVVDANAADALYDRPRHLRAAELVGFPRCNVLPGVLEAGGLCRTAILDFRLAQPTSFVGEVAVAARPEHIRHRPDGAPATIRLMENIGAECVVYFQAGEDTLVTSAAIAERGTSRLGLALSFCGQHGGPAGLRPRHRGPSGPRAGACQLP